MEITAIYVIIEAEKVYDEKTKQKQCLQMRHYHAR